MIMKDQIEILRGQPVEVISNGILYKGILMGASEENLSLQTPLQWVELPLEDVSSVRKSGS
ncbi:MAG: hypothetical protein HY036_03260 [Nitrospirae bacterium]|nr:hypothetical protein [Nitrospirota bacterium]MBI3351574.1 hypothetical protein [Nitrospirota bacterium]